MIDSSSAGAPDALTSARRSARQRRAIFWLAVGPFGVLLVGGMLRLGASLFAALWPARVETYVLATTAVGMALVTVVALYTYARFILPIMNQYYRGLGRREVDGAVVIRGLRFAMPIVAVGSVVAVVLPDATAGVLAIGLAVVYRLITIVALALAVERPR